MFLFNEGISGSHFPLPLDLEYQLWWLEHCSLGWSLRLLTYAADAARFFFFNTFLSGAHVCKPELADIAYHPGFSSCLYDFRGATPRIALFSLRPQKRCFSGFCLIFLNLLWIRTGLYFNLPFKFSLQLKKLFPRGLACWLCLGLFALCLLSLATFLFIVVAADFFPHCIKFTDISGLLYLLLPLQRMPFSGSSQSHTSTLGSQSDTTSPGGLWICTV